MRILHVMPSAAIAGTEIFVLRLAQHQNLCHEVVVAAPDGPVLEEFRRKDIKLIVMPIRQPTLRLLSKCMRSTLKRERPFDLIHVHSEAPLCRVARRMSPKSGVVFHCHGNYGLGFFLASIAINLWCDLAVAISKADYDAFRGGGASRKKLRLIHNGVVDIESSADETDRLATELGIDLGRNLVIGTLARLVRIKGIDTIIRAAALLKENHPDLRFVVAGTGLREKEFRLLSGRLGTTEIVKFAGLVRDVGSLLRMSSIYAHPARREPFGLAVAEAMSMGLPVVGSRVGGIIDQVVDGETGFLIPPNNASELARAIERLIMDEELRSRMGKRARAHQLRNFSFDGMVNRIEDVYAAAVVEAERRCTIS